MLTSAGKSYMVLAVPAGRLGASTAVYFIGSTLGSAVGSAAGGLLLSSPGGSFKVLGGSMAVASLPLLLIGALFPPPPLPLQLPPTLADAASPPRKPGSPIAKQTTRRPQPDGLDQRSHQQPTPSFCVFVCQPHVLCLAGWQCLRTVFWGAASLAMPFLMHQYSAGDSRLVGVFVLVSQLSAAVAMLSFGALSDTHVPTVGRAPFVLPALLTLAASSAGLAAAAQTRSPAGIFVAGTAATSVAWTLSGQVTPCAREVRCNDDAVRTCCSSTSM